MVVVQEDEDKARRCSAEVIVRDVLQLTAISFILGLILGVYGNVGGACAQLKTVRALSRTVFVDYSHNYCICMIHERYYPWVGDCLNSLLPMRTVYSLFHSTFHLNRVIGIPNTNTVLSC